MPCFNFLITKAVDEFLCVLNVWMNFIINVIRFILNEITKLYTNQPHTYNKECMNLLCILYYVINKYIYMMRACVRECACARACATIDLTAKSKLLTANFISLNSGRIFWRRLCRVLYRMDLKQGQRNAKDLKHSRCASTSVTRLDVRRLRSRCVLQANVKHSLSSKYNKRRCFQKGWGKTNSMKHIKWKTKWVVRAHMRRVVLEKTIIEGGGLRKDPQWQTEKKSTQQIIEYVECHSYYGIKRLAKNQEPLTPNTLTQSAD